MRLRCLLRQARQLGRQVERKGETVSHLVDAVTMYDPSTDGQKYEESEVKGLLKGPHNNDNGEVFNWFDIPKIEGIDTLLIGDWARIMEKHASACAALYLKQRQSLESIPDAVTRHYQIAQSKPVYNSSRLCVRSHVQHIFPDSRNITVFTEAVVPPAEVDKPPQSCIRLVSSIVLTTKGAIPKGSNYYAFHRDNAVY